MGVGRSAEQEKEVEERESVLEGWAEIGSNNLQQYPPSPILILDQNQQGSTEDLRWPIGIMKVYSWFREQMLPDFKDASVIAPTLLGWNPHFDGAAAVVDGEILLRQGCKEVTH